MRTQSRALIAIGLVVAVLLLALVLVLRSHARTSLEADAARAAATEQGAAAQLAEARSLASRREMEPARAPEPGPTPAPEPSAPATARTPPPKDAVGRLQVTVLDALTGAPVPRASVTFIGMRREDEPASEYLWPGDPPVAETDVRGVAHLDFPAWVHQLAPTRKLDTTVAHPEYVAFRGDLTVESLEQSAVVHLSRGGFLIVSGWIGSPSNVVHDVVPRVDDDAALDADSWLPMRDGRPSTNRLAPGPHAISISWRNPEGVTWHSRAEDFTLAPGEQREMSLELFPPSSLHGRFGEEVPRPVARGAVELSVFFGQRHGATTLRTWKADVEADGSFVIPGLPPGDAEIIALCDGWVSRTTPVPYEEGDYAWTEHHNPGLTVPAGEQIVVPMTRTASLAVRAVDASGAPVPGVQVDVWPNVVWRNGYSSFFLDRTWSAVTDARGEALVEHLPPNEQQGLAVRAAGWRRVGASGPRPEHLDVALVSGETARLTVELERDGG